jgi:hypothetical protein
MSYTVFPAKVFSLFVSQPESPYELKKMVWGSIRAMQRYGRKRELMGGRWRKAEEGRKEGRKEGKDALGQRKEVHFRRFYVHAFLCGDEGRREGRREGGGGVNNDSRLYKEGER